MATPSSKRVQKSFIEKAMDEWWRKSNQVNILITGKTGTGKSSLVNAILGKNIAVVGKSLDPETMDVTSFTTTIEGIEVQVWDSPGLQDGLNNEVAYLEDIEKNCKGKVDLFLYCISMENDRFVSGNRDIDAMCKLTAKLGKEIWEHAVLVLTCANKFISLKRSKMPKSEDMIDKLKVLFEDKLKEWRSTLKQCLIDEVRLSPEIAEKLPIVPTGKKGLPVFLKGMSPWLSKLWMESVLATRHTAQPALVKMNLQRLKFASDIHSEEEFHELLKKESIIIESRAGAIGKLVNAEEAATAVGVRSGIRAAIAHIIERIFDSTPYTRVLNTTVLIDEDIGVIAAHVVCMDIRH